MGICETCEFSGHVFEDEDSEVLVCYCKRYPPQHVGFQGDEMVPIFARPKMLANDWCGEFR